MASSAQDDEEEQERTPRGTGFPDGVEWSDAGSSAGEHQQPQTRDPSSTPQPDDRNYLFPVASNVVGDPLSGSLASLDMNGNSNVESPVPPQFAPGPSSTPRSFRARSASLSDLTAQGNANGTRLKSLRLGQAVMLAGPSTPNERYLLPGSRTHPVQFQGCGAYFCQDQRPVGDLRGRCTSMGKVCGDCGVYVCEVCISHGFPNRFYVSLSVCGFDIFYNIANGRTELHAPITTV
jgi:hypothetical protein